LRTAAIPILGRRIGPKLGRWCSKLRRFVRRWRFLGWRFFRWRFERRGFLGWLGRWLFRRCFGWR
jgi:hypothetical protein